MNLRQNTKRIFTVALVLWLSGIVVLFCCDMPANAASAEIESCPLAKKGNCAKTAEANAEHAFGQQPRTFDCCAFPAKIFDKARKLEKSAEPAEVAETIETTASEFSIVGRIVNSTAFYQSFVHNRGNAHLTNCVFRI